VYSGVDCNTRIAIRIIMYLYIYMFSWYDIVGGLQYLYCIP
jgi:hypothetical protein